MKLLLSIRPEFAMKIFEGTKKYEFRKRIPKLSVSEVVVYATSPTQKIIGEFSVNRIISGRPSSLWQKFNKYAGISRANFMKYFSGCTCGYAMEIIEPKLYKVPFNLRERYNCPPPQSFYYVER